MDCVALATVMVKELVVAVALLLSVTRTVMAKLPTCVAVPEIVLPESVTPAGRVPDAIAKVLPPDPPALAMARE